MSDIWKYYHLLQTKNFPKERAGHLCSSAVAENSSWKLLKREKQKCYTSLCVRTMRIWRTTSSLCCVAFLGVTVWECMRRLSISLLWRIVSIQEQILMSGTLQHSTVQYSTVKCSILYSVAYSIVYNLPYNTILKSAILMNILINIISLSYLLRFS